MKNVEVLIICFGKFWGFQRKTKLDRNSCYRRTVKEESLYLYFLDLSSARK
jgi:hypothetical protein